MQGPYETLFQNFEACKFQNAGYGLFLQIQTHWGKTQHILRKFDFVLEGKNNSAKCSLIIAVNEQILGLQGTAIPGLPFIPALQIQIHSILLYTHYW